CSYDLDVDVRAVVAAEAGLDVDHLAAGAEQGAQRRIARLGIARVDRVELAAGQQRGLLAGRDLRVVEAVLEAGVELLELGHRRGVLVLGTGHGDKSPRPAGREPHPVGAPLRQCTPPSSTSRTPTTISPIPPSISGVSGSRNRIRESTAVATIPTALQIP